jgi:2,4-dienoyl-CoA reductase-like NADH-dependent reductase (Old Yellow Enzyme family)
VDAASLFAPLSLPRSGVELSNRLVMAPMPTFAANPDGSVGRAELDYYGRRAAGLGAVITAGSAVSNAAVSFPGQWLCDRDELTASLAAVVQVLSPHSVPVLQLSHGGALAGCESVDQVVDSFRAGTRRAQQAGFVAVELHGGHRYLLHQFFSRRNATGGEWGGPTVEDRARLPLAVVEACSEYLPCWYRLDPEETGLHGILFEETIELAGRLVEAGVEVFDVSAKSYAQGSIIDDSDTRSRAALLSQQIGERAHVMAVGGIETVDQATAVLRDGCSLVGLGSVLLREPDWAMKASEGQKLDTTDPQPSSDTLVSLAVTEPVVRYLVKRGRVRDGN